MSGAIQQNGSDIILTSDDPCQPEVVTPGGNTSIYTYHWFICVVSINIPVAVYIDRIVTPIWYIIGLLGNIIIIKIWTSRRMRRNSTCALYLTVLAVTDLIMLCFNVFKELKFTWMVPSIDFPVWCSVFFVVFMFAQYMSPLLVFGFTVERFVSIIDPFRSERFAGKNRARIEIVVLTIFALGISMVQVHGWAYRNGECAGSETKFFSIWSWVTDMLMFGAVPITVLFLNMFVMRAANQSIKLRNEPTLNATETTNVRVSQRNSKLSPSTLTLLWVSFYRIFTTLPVSILYATQSEFTEGPFDIPVPQMSADPTWSKYFTWYTVKVIIDEIGLSQYSCNIFIYLATAKRFRKQFCDLCRSVRMCKPVHSEDFGRLTTFSNGGTTSIRMNSTADLSPILRKETTADL